jgi:hypothetical protein
MLTPSVPERSAGAYSWSPNTLESLLTDLRFANDLSSQSDTATKIRNTDIPGQINRTVALEWILTVTITDGLSREGSIRVLNTSGQGQHNYRLPLNLTPLIIHPPRRNPLHLPGLPGPVLRLLGHTHRIDDPDA